ncbi:MAG: NUDIX hydrolase N-terminal domain-containing protein, partial [Pseudomonadota bacterium]
MSDGSTKAPPPNTATPTPLREADDPWLTWAREVQAIGQTGLAYVQDVFDKERYERLNELAAEMMTALTDGTPPPFARLYAEQKGYATPKLDIR